jgi:hypothetical protein
MMMWVGKEIPGFLAWDDTPRAGQGQLPWKLWRWAHLGMLAVFLVLWVRAFWLIYADTGLFYYLGTDFAMYFSQSIVLWSDPSSIYSLEALNRILQPLFDAYSYNHPHADAVHVPYPPLFA